MKTKFKYFGILFISTTLIFTSCKKNGTGGEASIHARIENNSNPVIGSNILYIKFNATKQPADPTKNYDLLVEGEEGENHVHVPDLRPGKYYLYAVSFDSTSMKSFHGGAATNIKWSEKSMMKDVIIDVEID